MRFYRIRLHVVTGSDEAFRLRDSDYFRFSLFLDSVRF
ncbi:hypothetical protein HM1_1956 [Heliomicrobium modesticaldum Ice1]|uniref:Uncharacterized protein n=1 Tax=Heliobacterium modesticaldum (strain ATCC 51547 / Ice1) TaxID=498761 RepID=B0TFT4_HELMI|nr:hypothetical protein HM1_1956 [Heliomicrobium modesticaldum Ice1]